MIAETADTSGVRRALVLPTLLAATVLGTLANYIVNVPVRAIARDFHAPLSTGVLVVSGYIITLAAGLTLSGWAGDRIGRRRTLVAALALMACAMAGAALAPSLPVLVGMRAVQGLACAAIPPSVMGMLSDAYPRDRRARAIGAWAGANGVGQAVGPPLGGLIVGAWGWRGIFWLLTPVTIGVLVAAARYLPTDAGRPVAIHWPGALSLTAGAALLMLTATAVPEHAMPTWTIAVLGCAGAACVIAFLATSRQAREPFVRPALIVEARFFRSTAAAFAQMFTLATVAVAVPLYLTGALGLTTARTGALVFALPAIMTVSAPIVGSVSDRGRPRLVLRAGLVVLGLASLALGLYSGAGGRGLMVIVALLIVIGIGVALVQTPSAAGATRSPAGQSGAALGLFNMARFGGSALGAAWVATVYPHGALLVLFAGSALLVVMAFAVSFAGTDPEVTSA